MEKRELICITCPKGCHLTAEIENGQVVSVCGNSCPRGEKYAKEECVHPVRVLTSTVRVSGGRKPVVSVKTAAPIPKELLFDAMEEVRSIRAEAPVRIGQVLCENLCGTGVALLATGSAN